MSMNRQGYALIFAITALFLVVGVITLLSVWTSTVNLLVRLFALWSYLALAIATIMTPFLKEISQTLGKRFLTVHHVFAVLGTVWVTLHPVFYAVQTVDITVFLPRFDSWYDFWRLAGRPALIVLYVALVSALARRRARRFWRPFHALMYVALLFGIVHANLSGADFKNLAIAIIFDALFLAAMAVFALRRFRNHQMKKRSKSENTIEH